MVFRMHADLHVTGLAGTPRLCRTQFQGTMMKQQLIALAATGALLFTAGAAAADGYHSGSLKDDAPVAESCCSNGWGGLYIAGSVGWGFANVDYSHKVDGTTIGSFDDDFDGVTGTIAVGYDKVVSDGLLVGVFTDYTFGELDGTNSYTLPNSAVNTINLSYDNAWAVGARVGLIRDSILWYATAGYTHAELDTDVDELGDEDLDGYFLGAGFEKMLRDCWSLKVEYRFSDYGKTTLFDDVATGGGCTACRNKIDVDNEVHSIRVGLSYKFNAPRETAEYTPLK
jgi:outer membrane immunogenic protein